MDWMETRYGVLQQMFTVALTSPIHALQGLKKSFKTGDVILAARPFVYVIATSCLGRRCEGCFSAPVTPLKVECSCKYARYCSEACKDADLVNHRDECFYVRRKGTPPTSDTARFILR